MWAEYHHLIFSVSDHFELCLAKCRTSSSSVQHENTYRYGDIGSAKNRLFRIKRFRNKIKKFCYGKNPPPTVGSSSKP